MELVGQNKNSWNIYVKSPMLSIISHQFRFEAGFGHPGLGYDPSEDTCNIVIIAQTVYNIHYNLNETMQEKLPNYLFSSPTHLWDLTDHSMIYL